MSVNDKKVMCNGGTSADLSAKVAAGGKIRANWKQWTHEQGPVMVWMYKCAGDFKSCDGSGKKWFKVCNTIISSTCLIVLTMMKLDRPRRHDSTSPLRP
jgi:hypothetical protein